MFCSHCCATRRGRQKPDGFIIIIFRRSVVEQAAPSFDVCKKAMGIQSKRRAIVTKAIKKRALKKSKSHTLLSLVYTEALAVVASLEKKLSDMTAEEATPMDETNNQHPAVTNPYASATTAAKAESARMAHKKRQIEKQLKIAQATADKKRAEMEKKDNRRTNESGECRACNDKTYKHGHISTCSKSQQYKKRQIEEAGGATRTVSLVAPQQTSLMQFVGVSTKPPALKAAPNQPGKALPKAQPVAVKAGPTSLVGVSGSDAAAATATTNNTDDSGGVPGVVIPIGAAAETINLYQPNLDKTAPEKMDAKHLETFKHKSLNHLIDFALNNQSSILESHSKTTSAPKPVEAVARCIAACSPKFDLKAQRGGQQTGHHLKNTPANIERHTFFMENIFHGSLTVKFPDLLDPKSPEHVVLGGHSFTLLRWELLQPGLVIHCH
jgi:hypothetical protein